MALPAVTSQPGKTIVGRQLIVEVTPEGGAAIVFLAKKISGGPKKDHIERMAPSADGKIVRVDRRVPKSRKDAYTVELDEFIPEIIALLTGNNGKCTARLFVRDPDDAANVAAWSVVKSGATTAFNALAEQNKDFEFDLEASNTSTYGFQLLPTEEVEVKLDQLY